jgi:hypothetical protein
MNAVHAIGFPECRAALGNDLFVPPVALLPEMPFITSRAGSMTMEKSAIAAGLRALVDDERVGEWTNLGRTKLRALAGLDEPVDLVSSWLWPLLLEMVADALSLPELVNSPEIAAGSIESIESGRDIGDDESLGRDLTSLLASGCTHSIVGRLCSNLPAGPAAARMVGFLIAAALGPTRRVGGALLAVRSDLGEMRSPGEERAAVQEVLRWYSPAGIVYRSALGDGQIGDISVCEGDPVVVHLGLANWDPKRFPQPSLVSLTNSERHLAFGFGSHSCPGRHLAEAMLVALLRSTSGTEWRSVAIENLDPSRSGNHAAVPSVWANVRVTNA